MIKIFFLNSSLRITFLFYNTEYIFGQAPDPALFRHSLVQQENNAVLKLFPNPIVGTGTTLQISCVAGDAIYYQLLDIKGRVLFISPQEVATGNEYNYYLERDNLESGVYFLRVYIGGISAVKKFIVQ